MWGLAGRRLLLCNGPGRQHGGGLFSAHMGNSRQQAELEVLVRGCWGVGSRLGTQLQAGAVQCGAVRCSAVQCGAVRCSAGRSRSQQDAWCRT